MFVRAPRPALPTDAQAYVDSFDGHTFTNNCDVYRELIVQHPVLAEAMAFNSRVADVKTGIWNAIDAAVGTGYVDTIAVPADVGSGIDCDYTRTEAINSYSAKVAHCLWLEANKIFPWSLNDYSLTELKYLLDPNELFQSGGQPVAAWDIDGATPASQYALCDHSPKMLYDALSPTVSTASNWVEAFTALIDYMNDNFFHGTNTISRINSTWLTHGQTGGCGPASALEVGWARSVNIPATRYYGKYLESGHGNMTWFSGPGTGRVIFHGDDFYAMTTQAFPNVRNMEEFSTWDTQVGQESAPTDAYNAMRLKGLRYAAWWPGNAEGAFPYDQTERLSNKNAGGWPYMLARGGYLYWRYQYLTPQEVEFTYEAIRRKVGEGLPDKPTTSNSGTEGTLTTDTGTITMDATWHAANSGIYENMDLTGNIVIPQEASVLGYKIRNCKINGNGGIGIDIQSTNAFVEIYGCEITNCTWGVNGLPFWCQRSHFHSNSNTDLLMNNTAGGIQDETTIVGNLFEVGASVSNAVRVTTGVDKFVTVMANTITSSSTAPAIVMDGAPTSEVSIERNWIDGGNYCVQHNQTGSKTLFVAFNQFGRSASSGLFQDLAGPAHTWYGNTYEDDGSTANETDTAPL